MNRSLRLVRIFVIGLRFGLHDLGMDSTRRTPRAVRLRQALEALGPIFVKFGQMLSTRRDLLPLDIADELAKLQDRVPPFAAELAAAEIERSLGIRISEVFAIFEREADGERLDRAGALRHAARTAARSRSRCCGRASRRRSPEDLALLETAAGLIDRTAEGRRLRPREVVAEFARHLDEELDLMREAANASQLRRNFAGSTLLAVPEMHWELCSQRVMVMERMRGMPISQNERSVEKGVDIAALARAGVEIFFTQVFRDGFFHADMHPGNIFVSIEGETTGATSRSTSASWARSPTPTRATSRTTSSPSSTATTGASRTRTSRPAGCRPARASTSSRRRSAPCASRSSPGR